MLGAQLHPSDRMEFFHMADPVAISVGLQDFSGKRKSVVFFADDTTTAAQAQTLLDDTEPKLDAVIDARIVSAHVLLPLALSGTQKATAIDGNRVREGALLGYTAQGTSKRFGIYVPSWKNTGFNGDVVLNTGAFQTFITDMLGYDDDNMRTLLAYIDGVRTFRK